MAIPVPIPVGALTVTNTDNTNAETLLALYVQLLAHGTAGATITSPSVKVPVPGAPPTIPPTVEDLLVDTADEQLLHRHLFLAMSAGGLFSAAVIHVYSEVPAGTVGGGNAVFTTAHTFKSGSTRLFLNGSRQKPTTHYTESAGNTLTFVTPPSGGALLLVDYDR